MTVPTEIASLNKNLPLPEIPENSSQAHLKNVLIIDGAYLQIGINQMNQAHNLFFPLEQSGNFLALLGYLEKIGGHKFDQIRFVTAEDQETKHKYQKFYDAMEKAS